MCCCDAGKRRLLRCHLCAIVGGHASQRDTSHVHCHLCAVATLGSVASYTATSVLLRTETLFLPCGSHPIVKIIQKTPYVRFAYLRTGRCLAANIAKISDLGKCLKQRRLERFVSENLCFLDVKYGILGRKKRHIGLQSASYWPPICRILGTNMRQINAKKVVLGLPKSKKWSGKGSFLVVALCRMPKNVDNVL